MEMHYIFTVFFIDFINFYTVSQACCDVAFSYAHVREQFGTKIGEFQVNLYILHLCLEHKLIWGHNGRHNVVSSTPRLSVVRPRVSGDRH
jgi:hypothetical protein